MLAAVGDWHLSWPAVPGASEYRVLIRDLTSDRFIIDEVVDHTAFIPRSDGLGEQSHHSWQVLWRGEDKPDWRPAMPELPLGPEEPSNSALTARLEWEDDGANAYRVLIRDSQPDGLLLKLPVCGTSYTVDYSALPAGTRLRWRVQRWDLERADWQDLEPYAPLPPAQSPLRMRTEEPIDTTPGAPRVLLLFTIDTEANLRYAADPDPRRAVDGHIFCRHPGGDAGIEMIMGALDRHGFKGTFFLDVLSEYQFGEGALEPVVEAIQRRGHDIQLHLHTAPHLRFASEEPVRRLSGAMGSYDPDQFRRALELAVRLFVERVGEEPVAYRSGAYAICDSYLDVLAEFGLRIDSSIYAFKNCKVSPWMRGRTQPFRIGSLLEVPVIWRLEWRASGPVPMQFAPWRPGDDDNRSFTALKPPPTGPPTALVYLAHSYQYLARGPDIDGEEQRRWHRTLETRLLSPEHAGLYDLTDPPWFFGPPDAARIELLERNLAVLAARGDVVALPMRALAVEYHDAWDRRSQPVDPLPEVVDAAGGMRRLTATSVYSVDYLRHVEETGATAGAR
jgi:peptidoglycan/xylan/chitin deacetylase (PgdA/CDA1 family)